MFGFVRGKGELGDVLILDMVLWGTTITVIKGRRERGVGRRSSERELIGFGREWCVGEF